MFVSPFPHEPALLYFAKTNPALYCMAASTLAALFAGMWDYWLFVPLVHHPRVRTKYVNHGLYRVSVGLFRKSPFWALVIVGLTPLPFYPVKFLSIADGYPMKRYLAALLVGRTPRYYLIAYLGYILKLPNWSLIALALVILVITVYKSKWGNGAGQ
jgi:ribonucleoside-triphosphate reductase